MVRSPEQTASRPQGDVGDRSHSNPNPSPVLPALLPRRRWPRRILITLNVFVALCLLATASTYGYFEWKFGSISRVSLHFPTVLPGVPDPPSKAMNVLLVGSDTRSGLSKADQKRVGSTAAVPGGRSDTMMILHVDPNQKKAAILSLPRDLLVRIASTGREDRINSAIEKGPQNLINTITQDFGIPIDHYIEVDFNGFRGIVQAVGNVNVYFPSRARDVFSNLNIKTPGCVALNGDQSLAYVRSRHYQYYEGGRWHDEGDGDLGRIQRQQDFIRRVLGKVKGVRDPLTINRLIDSGIHNVTIDSGLSAGDIIKLAGKFKSLSPDAVDMETLPTTPGSTRLGGQVASILRPKQPEAQAMIDRFNGKTAAPDQAANVPNGVLPGAVQVRVLNGNGQTGYATKVASAIGPNGTGFGIAGTGDADNFRYSQSVISYGSGQKAAAQLLQSVLRSPAQLKEDPSLKGVNLVLVVGSDYGGVKQLAGATPTTTAPTTTTTAAAPAGSATGKPAAASC